jgi:hypothetical protein
VIDDRLRDSRGLISFQIIAGPSFSALRIYACQWVETLLALG